MSYINVYKYLTKKKLFCHASEFLCLLFDASHFHSCSFCYSTVCVFQAETAQKVACEKFDQMSDKGKEGKSLSHIAK